MTQDLSALYDYRVSNSVVTVMKPNNYQCATQIVSWHKKGFNGQHITAEKRVNGEWTSNPAAFELAAKQEEKNGTQKGTEVEITKVSLKTAANKLARIASLIGRADTMTEDHISQLEAAYSELQNMFDTSEESEESYA